MHTAGSISSGIRYYLRTSLGILAVGMLLSATSATGTQTEPKAKVSAAKGGWYAFGVCDNSLPPGHVDRCDAAYDANNEHGPTRCVAPCLTLSFDGKEARDFHQNDGGSDYTGSSPSGSNEISSGWNGLTGASSNLSNANCGPACPGATIGPLGPCLAPGCIDCSRCGTTGYPACTAVGKCGPMASAFFSYVYDENRPMAYLFLRMRVAGRVADNSGTSVNATNGFNFLVDLEGEGWKEFWLDWHKGGNLVNLFYDDKNSQQIDNDCPGPGRVEAGGNNQNCKEFSAPGTPAARGKINEFLGCMDDSQSANCLAYSITRAVLVKDPVAPDDWYADIQVPMAALSTYTGGNPSLVGETNVGFPGTTGQDAGARAPGTAWSWDSTRRTSAACTLFPGSEACEFYPLSQDPPAGSPPYKGNGPFSYLPSTTNSLFTTNAPATIPSYMRINVATGASNTDPVQKDFLSYGASSTTPVTLSAFRATSKGTGLRFEWSTVNEVGNAGFDLWALRPDGWTKVNEALVLGSDSMDGEDYAFETRDLEGATLVRIESVASDGSVEVHGPFALDRTYGGPREAAPIDWQEIAEESGAKAKARESAKVARAAAKSRSAKQDVAKGTPPGLAGYPEARFRVTESGLHRVTYEQLAAVGVDLAGVPAPLLALTSRNRPVPVRVEVAKGNAFGPGSFVEFYGEGMNTLYTRTNVYRLAVDPQSAVHVAADNSPAGKGVPASFYMETTEVERDRAYSATSSIDDPWYDDRITTAAPTSRDYTVSLDNVVPGGSASVSVLLWGASAPGNGRVDHHVQTFVNGTFVAEKHFAGLAAASISGSVGSDALFAGDNKVTVRFPMDLGAPYEIVSIDKYSVTYPRAFVARGGRLSFSAAGPLFRVSGLPSPSVVVYRIGTKKVENVAKASVSPSAGGGYEVTFGGSADTARYVVASVGSLLEPVVTAEPETEDPTIGDAQYVIVSHPDFIGLDALDALAAAKRSQGLTVKVVDVDDVYEKFNGGVLDPEAIRAFVDDSARRGTEYVLLVGGDTRDYLGILATPSISFIPTFYTRISPVVGFAPSDGVFADLDGDFIADLPIGRLSVKTSADLAAVVAKTLAYPGAGARKALFAADEKAATGVSFAGMGESAVQWIGTGWTPERAYVDDLGVSGAREALIAAINGGVALTSYFGHSDVTYWSFSQLFNTGHMSRLTNAAAPTIVAQYACWNTYFVHPTLVSLGDRFLLTPDRGAAAVIGPSSLMSSEADRRLSKAFSWEVAQNPGITVGRAFTNAKAALRNAGADDRDALYSTNLLGDPALVIP